MESALYVMIYLMNDNKLPWCDIEKRLMQQDLEFKDVLKERLEAEYTKRLIKMIPSKVLSFFAKLNY